MKNNKLNNILRIWIMVLVVCSVAWVAFDILSTDKANRDTYRIEMEQEEIVDPLTSTEIEVIPIKTKSPEQPQFIDSPIRLLPTDADRNMQDSIKNIFKKILEYYEQSAAGQQAKA